MRKFTFRLEPVLKHRQVLEEQAARELAHAQRELLDQQKKLFNIEESLQKTFQEAGPGVCDLAALLNENLYREYLTILRNCQQEEVSKAYARTEECRLHTVQKRRDRMMLEKLKEKKLTAYLEDAKRASQKELDEQGTQRVVYKTICASENF